MVFCGHTVALCGHRRTRVICAQQPNGLRREAAEPVIASARPPRLEAGWVIASQGCFLFCGAQQQSRTTETTSLAFGWLTTNRRRAGAGRQLSKVINRTDVIYHIAQMFGGGHSVGSAQQTARQWMLRPRGKVWDAAGHRSENCFSVCLSVSPTCRSIQCVLIAHESQNLPLCRDHF